MNLYKNYISEMNNYYDRLVDNIEKELKKSKVNYNYISRSNTTNSFYIYYTSKKDNKEYNIRISDHDKPGKKLSMEKYNFYWSTFDIKIIIKLLKKEAKEKDKEPEIKLRQIEKLFKNKKDIKPGIYDVYDSYQKNSEQIEIIKQIDKNNWLIKLIDRNNKVKELNNKFILKWEIIK